MVAMSTRTPAAFLSLGCGLDDFLGLAWGSFLNLCQRCAGNIAELLGAALTGSAHTFPQLAGDSTYATYFSGMDGLARIPSVLPPIDRVARQLFLLCARCLRPG